MKPFDLEAFKNGQPALTRGGQTMRFVAHVPDAEKSQRLLAIDGVGVIWKYYSDGCYSQHSGHRDLTHMAPKKVQFWGQAYRRGATGQLQLAVYTSNEMPYFLAGNEEWIDPEPFLIREYEE